MERWQEELFTELVDTHEVVRVPSNGRHTRFYTEPLASEQWDCRHHLLDLEDVGSGYSHLTITELSTSGSTQVRLTCNEVNDLLSVLLHWRVRERSEQIAQQIEVSETAFDLLTFDSDEFP